MAPSLAHVRKKQYLCSDFGGKTFTKYLIYMKQNMKTNPSALPERILYLCAFAAWAAEFGSENTSSSSGFGTQFVAHIDKHV